MRDEKRSYTNGEVTVYWDPELCIHVMNCIRNLPEVYNSSKRPWVNIHGAGTREIIRATDTCPTGAISWKMNRDIKDHAITDKKESNSTTAQISLVEDGPILIKGDYEMFDESGCIIKSGKNITLCRCGGSGNKPYCDGTHKEKGYRSKN